MAETDYSVTDFGGAILPIFPRGRGLGGHGDESGDGGSHPGDTSDGGASDGPGEKEGDDSAGGGGPKENPWDSDGSSISLNSAGSRGSHSSSDEEFPQAQGSQAPVDIVDRGYISQPEAPIENGRCTIDIYTEKVPGPLDTLILDLKSDSIGVQLAMNKEDMASDNPGKVPLRAIIIDTWLRYSGKPVGDLKRVDYHVVVEKQMKAAYPKAYQAAGRDYNPQIPAPLTVLRDTNPQSAYSILMNTAFGGGAQKMLAETAGLEGRTVESIDLFPEMLIDVRFNF